MKKGRETICLLGPQEERHFAKKGPSPSVETHSLKLSAEMMREWSWHRVCPSAVKQGLWACGPAGASLIILLNAEAPGLPVDFQDVQLGVKLILGSTFSAGFPGLLNVL